MKSIPIKAKNGITEWRYIHGLGDPRCGILHREDGPAKIWPDGAEEWWVEGRKHRDGDLPAFIEETIKNGSKRSTS